MHIRRQIAILGFASLMLTGCFPDALNCPPGRYAFRENRMLGDFYVEDRQTGKREDGTIDYQAGSASPYRIRGLKDGMPDNSKSSVFQLFKIAEELYAFVKNDDTSEVRYWILRAKITRTQIVLESLDEDYFKSNPKALPGTKIIGQSVELRATPEQLVNFFTLHGGSDEMFDTKNPLLLNRIP